MVKGKHAPAKGAVRPDKLIHPKSRKAGRLQTKELRKHKMANLVKAGGAKLQAIGEKLAWFKENLSLCQEDEKAAKMTKQEMVALAEAFLSRFEEELEQINLKNSVGGGMGKRNLHAARLDLIRHTMEREKEEFEGCGLEMPDLLDQENAKKFMEWEGELRFVQNLKVKRFNRTQLTESEQTEEEMDT